MKTGREDELQLPVPALVRAAVPARYGVEIIQPVGEMDKMLIISDQLSNLHCDVPYRDDYAAMTGDQFRERIVDPVVSTLRGQAALRAA